MAKERMCADARREQVMEALLSDALHPVWSLRRLARYMGMKPSSHLVSLIDPLVDERKVDLIVVDHHGVSGRKFFYCLHRAAPIEQGLW